ncbi:MAG: NADH-quinone oxidoreductase subunit J [Coriobacteriia bacterium]|nr:NADH-quinone oxidoreductase subunit J [Coriobacteriia bacterium]
MSIEGVLFYAYAAVAVIGAVGVVFAPRLIHAVVWLFITMIALAGLYLLIGSELLAGVQLFIYGGAVTILALFAIILARPTNEARPSGISAWVAGAGSAALLAALGVAVAASASLDTIPGPVPLTAAIATELFTRHVVLFEVAGLLLTVALVGAIIMARTDGDAS